MGKLLFCNSKESPFGLCVNGSRQIESKDHRKNRDKDTGQWMAMVGEDAPRTERPPRK